MNEATITRLNIGNRSGRMTPEDLTELAGYLKGQERELTLNGVNTALKMMRTYLGIPQNQAFAPGTDAYRAEQALYDAHPRLDLHDKLVVRAVRQPEDLGPIPPPYASADDYVPQPERTPRTVHPDRDTL